MKIGIIGKRKAGKTTIFNTITKMNIPLENYDLNKIKPNKAAVAVIDNRISKLKEIYKPKKVTYPKIECIDFIGKDKKDNNSEIYNSEEISLIKVVDALAIVLRNFDDEIVDNNFGKKDPLSDFSDIIDELILSDIIQLEKRIKKIEERELKGIAKQNEESEKKFLIKIKEDLEGGTFDPKTLTDEQSKKIKEYKLLCQMKKLIILNSDEENFGSFETDKQFNNIEVIEFPAKFELELDSLNEEERTMFLEDMGIKKSAVSKLTTALYKLLDYISFFTVGKDEVKAWTIKKGTKAPQAAGKIHSDLEKGFIRAERFHYNDIIRIQNEKELRNQGLVKPESRNYVVKDGDILSIRFNK